MLDAQRYSDSSLYAEFRLARAIILAHLVLGIAAVILLFLHEIFPWALAAAGWYATTVLTFFVRIKGGFRTALSLLFLSFSACGIYFLAQVAPNLAPATPPLLGHGSLSIWLGLANLVYAIGGLFFLLNPRIRKVTNHGFSFR